MKWIAPGGCAFEAEDFPQILVAPGRCDPLLIRNWTKSTAHKQVGAGFDSN